MTCAHEAAWTAWRALAAKEKKVPYIMPAKDKEQCKCQICEKQIIGFPFEGMDPRVSLFDIFERNRGSGCYLSWYRGGEEYLDGLAAEIPEDRRDAKLRECLRRLEWERSR